MVELGADLNNFVVEHIIHYMFVPGKVENWLVIVDATNVGLTNVPTVTSMTTHRT